MTTAHLLVTGTQFTGQGHRAVWPVILDLVRESTRELAIAAYIVSEPMRSLLDEVELALQRGVAVTLVLNRSDDFQDSVIARVRSLSLTYPAARMVWFQDPEAGQLHAKAVVSDRRRAVVGSANLTRGGLLLNHEIGVLLEGQAAWDLGDLIQDLARHMTRIQ